MKLRTYQADSMPAALVKLKADLGRDAVIVATRTFRKRGLLGLRSRQVYEITATDEGRDWHARSASPAAPIAVPAAAAHVPATSSPAGPPLERRNRAARRAASRAAPPAVMRLAHPVPRTSAVAEAPSAAVMGELRVIRQIVTDVLGVSRRGAQPDVPDNLLDEYTRLIGQQVADELARRLIDEVSQAGNGVLTVEAIRNALLQRIAGMLDGESAMPDPVAAPTPDSRPRVIALVGPTGVGKTTTIAKLAAQFKLRDRRRVGLVTIDTYRIAAVEQLKVYANILEVPLQVVLSPDDMPAALERLRDCHTILLDTAGRSQRDTRRISDLAQYLSAARPDEVHLVVSSAASERSILETVRNFAPLTPHRLIFTKLDESAGLGLILNVVGAVGMRISFITNGQSVPNDLAPACGRQLAEWILTGDTAADSNVARVA